VSAMDSPNNNAVERWRWLAEQADWIASGSRAGELGRRARRAFLDRTQIRNLQRVAETSNAVSTLTDYVKVQTGTLPLWRRENFGQMLLDDLDRLQARVGGPELAGIGTHVDLCRLYVRQLAAAYLYSIAVDATTSRPAAPAPRPAPAPRDTPRPARQRGPRATAPAGPAEAEASATIAGEQPAGDTPPPVAPSEPVPDETAPAPPPATDEPAAEQREDSLTGAGAVAEAPGSPVGEERSAEIAREQATGATTGEPTESTVALPGDSGGAAPGPDPILPSERQDESLPASRPEDVS
jgi:hypothetical protein